MIQSNMKRIKLADKSNIEEAILDATDVLLNGGVILYPTDTLYGIGVDATNDAAIQKVFDLKRRDSKKPLSVMVSDLKIARKYALINSLGERLMSKILPGPFTLVFPKKDNLPDKLTAGEKTLGIRIPDTIFCNSLTINFGKPITATSANVAGDGNQINVDDILQQFGKMQHMIDLVIEEENLSNGNPSTVLKVSDTSVEVLREGNVNHPTLLHVTKAE